MVEWRKQWICCCVPVHISRIALIKCSDRLEVWIGGVMLIRTHKAQHVKVKVWTENKWKGGKNISCYEIGLHISQIGAHMLCVEWTRCTGWAKSYVTAIMWLVYLLFGRLVRRFLRRFRGNDRKVLVTTAAPAGTNKRKWNWCFSWCYFIDHCWNGFA